MSSITDDILLSFSGCSTLAEIEDLVLRDQGLTSMQVGSQVPRYFIIVVLRAHVFCRACSAACDFRRLPWHTMHCLMLTWTVLCPASPSSTFATTDLWTYLACSP
jgi:hypothetical protein